MRKGLVVAIGMLVLLSACTPDTSTGTLPDFGETASFVVLGDFGDGSEAEYEVAAAIERSVADEPIDALITTGDNFYSNDVDLIWNEPYGWVEDSDIPVLAAWGNHDVESSHRVELVEETLAPPGRWSSGALGAGRLIILDSTQIDVPDQTEWLESELSGSGHPIVVIFHHPALSCGSHGSTGSVMDRWMPLFEMHDVDLVLNGHDHDYERFDQGETTYVVTGGGGRLLRPLEECPSGTPEPEAANDTDHHFVRLELSDGQLEGVVLNTSGGTIDEFIIDR